MRTTVDLDDDVVAAVNQLRREENLGLSQAANELIRRGLARRISSPDLPAADRPSRPEGRRGQRGRGDRARREPIGSVMLLDANVLLYAVDEASPFHAPARGWLERVLNGDRRVGMLCRRSPPSFASPRTPAPRRSRWRRTRPGASSTARWPLEVVWIPSPTPRHATIAGDLVRRYQLRGNLVADAHLAALAIEHGLTVISADTDFARFREARWENPLR